MKDFVGYWCDTDEGKDHFLKLSMAAYVHYKKPTLVPNDAHVRLAEVRHFCGFDV